MKDETIRQIFDADYELWSKWEVKIKHAKYWKYHPPLDVKTLERSSISNTKDLHQRLDVYYPLGLCSKVTYALVVGGYDLDEYWIFEIKVALVQLEYCIRYLKRELRDDIEQFRSLTEKLLLEITSK
jgi:hypothetical protein